MVHHCSAHFYWSDFDVDPVLQLFLMMAHSFRVRLKPLIVLASHGSTHWGKRWMAKGACSKSQNHARTQLNLRCSYFRLGLLSTHVLQRSDVAKLWNLQELGATTGSHQVIKSMTVGSRWHECRWARHCLAWSCYGISLSFMIVMPLPRCDITKGHLVKTNTMLFAFPASEIMNLINLLYLKKNSPN